jgi:hypothetical protein
MYLCDNKGTSFYISLFSCCTNNEENFILNIFHVVLQNLKLKWHR